MKPGSKYYPLYQRFSQIGAETFTLTIDEIQAHVESQLPTTARTKTSWWANRRKGGYQSQAWIKAGYRVAQVELAQQRVTFKKFQAEYKIQREAGAIKWDQAAIRALRLHMNLTQSQFAEAIGVRRQTISEWENGVYAPDRSTMKHLGLVAEKEAFAPANYYIPPAAE
ncbi:MAG: helix-turn-helix transcriptional regulator [Leptolyngbya sp. SIOISBB]|nr:helix-turn-helix transcriptional regulator [Leptolyngbya sp. SIOISBB]